MTAHDPHSTLEVWLASAECADASKIHDMPDLAVHLRLHLGSDALWAAYAWGQERAPCLLMVGESVTVFMTSRRVRDYGSRTSWSVSDQRVSSAPHRRLRTLRTTPSSLTLDFAPPVFGETPLEIPIADWTDTRVTNLLQAIYRARRTVADRFITSTR